MSKNSLFLFTFFVVLGLSRPLNLFAASTRGEIQRFTLLHDRLTIDRSLRERSHTSFLNIDLAISSGVFTLINDLSNSSDNTSSSAVQKQLEVFNLLSKNINTERFIDANIELGMPLPDIKVKSHRFYNSLFYEFNAGILLTIASGSSATNPLAQTYVRKQTKLGFSTIYKPKEDITYQASLYQLSRADTAANLDTATLAGSGEFFNLDDLKKDHSFYALDFSYQKKSARGKILFSAEELQLHSTTDQKSLYGTSPLLRAEYTWFLDGGRLLYQPFVGSHYRKWYPFHRGVYGGVHLLVKDENIPFSATIKASNQFITLMPQFKADWFHFSYTFKNPYRNPQDDIWVASLHNIQITIPFP